MIEVKNANLKDMHNKQLVSYIGEFIVMVGDYSASTFSAVQQHARLVNLCNKAEQILAITNESPFTEQIEQSDDNREEIFITFRNTVKAFLTHYDPVIREMLSPYF